MKERHPFNDYLKGTALREKEAQIEKMGLNMDPEKLPELLPKDADLADYLRKNSEEEMMERKTRE